MSDDGRFITCLVERLVTRLPHRSGTGGLDLAQDDVVLITRASLVKLSATSIVPILDALTHLLEELSASSPVASTHPTYILLSELYILNLLADCCKWHWDHLAKRESAGGVFQETRWKRRTLPYPDTLDEALVSRLMDVLRVYIAPLPEGYTLPASSLLEDSPGRKAASAPLRLDGDNHDSRRLLDLNTTAIEMHIQTVVEYLTASSWTVAFDHFRKIMFVVRNGSGAVNVSSQDVTTPEHELAALVTLRLVGWFWVDGNKLGMVIQEFCSSYLHLRRPFQHTVAVVAPMLITRWIDRYPSDFVEFHSAHRRLDGGADTLFDMTQTVVDPGKKRALLFPLQINLLFLLPDVFEVASNLREAKGGSMSKKVGFLDSLRKALRNRNEQAAYCLVSLLRVARHFDAESDSALLSYAMDVQDEVRDAVFRRHMSSSESAAFEQDIMTASVVCLAHLSFDSCVESLVPACLAQNAPLSFKAAVIQACAYFAGLDDREAFEPLFGTVAGFVQSQLKAMTAFVTNAYIVEAQPGQPIASEPANAVAIICDILEFLQLSPTSLFKANAHAEGTDDDGVANADFENFITCLVAPNDRVRHLGVSAAKAMLANDEVAHTILALQRLKQPSFMSRFSKLSCVIMIEACKRAQPEDAQAKLASVQHHLMSRLLLLDILPPIDASQEVTLPEREEALQRLEALFLTSLCSADVALCQVATTCVGLLVEYRTMWAANSDPSRPPTAFARNAHVFKEIASREFRLTGLVAFQRRISGLLRRLSVPSLGLIEAWKTVFNRWEQLSQTVSSAQHGHVNERDVAEWRNSGGFLAALGGICISEQAAALRDTEAVNIEWIDNVLAEDGEDSYLTTFLRLSTRLMASTDVRVREIMRDVLSNEIPSTLYSPLFRILEEEVEALFAGSLPPEQTEFDVEIVFAEQAIQLSKALIERLDGPADLGSASSIHLGALALNLVKFLDGTTPTLSSLKVRIKACQLSEAVARRKEHLNLRDDVRIRNQLLECIFGWIARPNSSQRDVSGVNGARHDETSRVQKDLDKAALQSLAELTYRLPLQHGDNQAQSDIGTSELKSQLFHTYFNRFLTLLNIEATHLDQLDHAGGGITRDEESTTSEVAITILSNLLSANIDVGLKHSLSIGYHETVEIRTAFVKVLYNILVQGTEFSNLSDAAITKRYDELLELLTRDTTLAVAISAVCPSSELDEVTISLLNIYESRGCSFELLEALIRHEVEETENETELLRRTCMATKMLSLYAKWKGADYLKATLQKVVERLILSSEDLDLELDPTKLDSLEDAENNALQLQIVSKVFIEDICASVDEVPPSFRRICNIASISEAVTPRFKDAKYTAVGAFIFLRFFCPAIVAPEVEGLITATPSKEMRRALLLIAKVIQNLANNVLFGVKEQYMYPLNDFLTQNIYHVTTFLREISVSPDRGSLPGSTESFDFGSCIALHRFLYDFWDQIRQRITVQERRAVNRSPSEALDGRASVQESLRNLILNLGPPSLAASWNRPQLSLNAPPTYSRFQNFMLRNAFRNPESFVTARAVYDGGESKDGLSIICIILRNVDAESIDFDTLIYCYLKIASRLWHKPFGILIDATCYSGINEPQDDLFRKLELLMPAELARNLLRIYVYNMNSAFRKCMRRMLRVAAKDDASAFNPNIINYHLIGNLQELQSHFHLSQLHLPKETISVVTDTRYVFQSITRLSKTKGRIEVEIKVGSQFVQVTTTKKQEIHPGFRLNAAVNDIFRLIEVDETPSPHPSEDDSAFGLRADNGKIVMYFTSSKKADVLHAIRGAKTKHGKDVRAHKTVERLIRPQDVPGTLLNLALTNLMSADYSLRLASYNLLGALCRAFEFKLASTILCAKDLAIPLEPARFVLDISSELASTENQLTADFLNEFFVGWDSFSDEQKPLSLAYIAPWVAGLGKALLATEVESDKARDRVAGLLRKLIGIVVTDPALSFPLDQCMWPIIARDEYLLEIFFDEIIKASLSAGLHDEQAETLTAILTSIDTVSLRGKVISRLRKALNRSSLRPTRMLAENAVWPEVCILLQACVSLAFNNPVQAQMFLPELFHIVTMLVNSPTSDVRQLVHRLLINTIHAACTSFLLDDGKQDRLVAILELISEGRSDIFLGAPSTAASRDSRTMTPIADSTQALVATEHLASLLLEICAIAAPSADVANMWRSRWMSLVASTAFQNNPAIQPRAFCVMGCLAREEVDDDLLYQVLVSLRNSIGRFDEESNSEMLVAIINSLSKMMAKLPSASRYGVQLFWLAISLLRLVPMSLFNCAGGFLEAVLTNLSTSTEMHGDEMAEHLLQGRIQLQDAATPLDDLYGIQFNEDNFHFAACACIVRGLTDSMTKPMALRLLATFLDLTLANAARELRGLEFSPYLSLILARAVSSEELRDNLWNMGITMATGLPSAETLRLMQNLDKAKDHHLLINTAIGLVDFHYFEDAVQSRKLRWLNKLAVTRPFVIRHLYGIITSLLDEVLQHCQNAQTLESAQDLLQTLTSDPTLASGAESSAVLSDELSSMGFGGLWRSCGVDAHGRKDKQGFELTEKLIELIII